MEKQQAKNKALTELGKRREHEADLKSLKHQLDLENKRDKVAPSHNVSCNYTRLKHVIAIDNRSAFAQTCSTKNMTRWKLASVIAHHHKSLLKSRSDDEVDRPVRTVTFSLSRPVSSLAKISAELKSLGFQIQGGGNEEARPVSPYEFAGEDQ